MTKLILILSVASALAIAGALTKAPTKQQMPNTLGQEKDKGSLKRIAEKAKLEGKTEATIRSPLVEYLGEEDSPDFAFSHFSLVIAEPIDEKTYTPNSDDIITWYKFRIVETLRQQPPCSSCPVVDPPAEMMPVNDDEFLLAKYGGSASIDGVNITMNEPGLPPFSKNNQYLLLISKNPSGTAMLWAGPNGAFHINLEGNIEPVNKRPHPMKDVMKARFGNSIGQLRQQLKHN